MISLLSNISDGQVNVVPQRTNHIEMSCERGLIAAAKLWPEIESVCAYMQSTDLYEWEYGNLLFSSKVDFTIC